VETTAGEPTAAAAPAEEAAAAGSPVVEAPAVESPAVERPAAGSRAVAPGTHRRRVPTGRATAAARHQWSPADRPLAVQGSVARRPAGLVGRCLGAAGIPAAGPADENQAAANRAVVSRTAVNQAAANRAAGPTAQAWLGPVRLDLVRFGPVRAGRDRSGAWHRRPSCHRCRRRRRSTDRHSRGADSGRFPEVVRLQRSRQSSRASPVSSSTWAAAAPGLGPAHQTTTGCTSSSTPRPCGPAAGPR
jgi:hypothetical protein